MPPHAILFSLFATLIQRGSTILVQLQIDQFLLCFIQRAIGKRLADLIEQQFGKQLPRSMQQHAHSAGVYRLPELLA